jgi:multiple sugar transport system ATP-binding protein
MTGVVVSHLSIHFGKNEVIHDLNLEVKSGEFMVLLGPSGCGKSTLLHSIAGLIDTSAGSIHIGGKDMTHADPTDRQIGMVFQSYALYPTMSVQGNLSFGLRVNRTPKAEIAKRVARVADMLQLTPLLARKPAQLSGGQRQRVAIGRALVREAGVFLFDEPLSNLDAKLRGELRRELKLLHKTLGSTMVYVTHDQVEAMTLANRIVVMRNGKIQQIGAPAEVYDKPDNLFVAGFLGSPSMNFLHGMLSQNQDALFFESAALRVNVQTYPFQEPPVPGMEVILGIRPENVRIHAQGAFAGKVSLIEPMGSHHIVWLECGETQLGIISTDTHTVRLDEVVRFDLDLNKISVLSRATEQRL